MNSSPSQYLPIVSWTTTERFIRTTLLTLLFTGFCAWCFYDRYVGYPRENVAALAQDYPDLLDKLPDADQRVTAEWAAAIKQGTPLDEVVKQVGPPDYRDAERAVYFGEAGKVELPLSRSSDLLRGDAVWTESTKHTAVDLKTQFFMGIGLVPVALWLILVWLRMMLTRVELTEAGLRVRGRPLVPFEAMTRLDDSQYARKGWVDVHYQVDGRPGTIRLDDYHHKEFKPIVAEICRRKGFAVPVPAREAAQ